MLRKFFVILLALVCSLAAFGQVKPRLGILPFTGGPAGEAETITTLLSFQTDIMGAFTVVPRTNAVTAMVMDQNYQLSGYPDSDTLAQMGRMLGSDFVVAGYIRSLGDRNLVTVNVINSGTGELMAGDYREYRKIEEVPALLPDMARTIIYGSRRDTSSLPKLAVAPFRVAEGISEQEVDTLGQVLTTNILGTGRYVLVPRTTTLLAARRELDYQTRGYITPPEEARALGRMVNTRYVLNTEVHNVGSAKMLYATIYNVDDGSVVAEGSRSYRTISDGIPVMAELARLLSPSVAPVIIPPPAPVPAPQPTPQPAPQPAPEPVPAPQPVPQPVPQPAPQPVPAPQPAPQPAPPPEPVPAPEPAPEPVLAEPPAPEPIHVEPSYAGAAESAEAEQPVKEKKQRVIDPLHYWTLGISAGTSFTTPWVIATVHGTISPFRNSFLELGCDLGLINLSEKVKSYYSIYPFAHLAYFKPFTKGGWYIGAGAGYMMAFYKFSAGDIQKNIFAADLIAGVNLFNFLDISYTLRASPWTDLKAVSHKVSLGYVYRF